MAKVVRLETIKPIPPKSETYEHAGQKYTIRCDPNAPGDRRWVWSIDYIRIYPYFGSSPSLQAAAIAARKEIHRLNKETIAWDEISD